MFSRTRYPPQLSRGDPLGRSELSFWKKNGRALCERQEPSLWRSSSIEIKNGHCDLGHCTKNGRCLATCFILLWPLSACHQECDHITDMITDQITDMITDRQAWSSCDLGSSLLYFCTTDSNFNISGNRRNKCDNEWIKTDNNNNFFYNLNKSFNWWRLGGSRGRWPSRKSRSGSFLGLATDIIRNQGLPKITHAASKADYLTSHLSMWMWPRFVSKGCTLSLSA